MRQTLPKCIQNSNSKPFWSFPSSSSSLIWRENLIFTLLNLAFYEAIKLRLNGSFNELFHHRVVEAVWTENAFWRLCSELWGICNTVMMRTCFMIWLGRWISRINFSLLVKGRNGRLTFAKKEKSVRIITNAIIERFIQ